MNFLLFQFFLYINFKISKKIKSQKMYIIFILKKKICNKKIIIIIKHIVNFLIQIA